jgi:hypothetical protein
MSIERHAGTQVSVVQMPNLETYAFLPPKAHTIFRARHSLRHFATPAMASWQVNSRYRTSSSLGQAVSDSEPASPEILKHRQTIDHAIPPAVGKALLGVLKRNIRYVFWNRAGADAATDAEKRYALKFWQKQVRALLDAAVIPRCYRPQIPTHACY